ncbi:MAG: TldD family protein, Actinobacterial subgroup [uncultured Corynebacteriales bacterium]|uniref:TldD family protein, Actinobacterial subgroup n=1 Tax=uncultured Mycobacteriales bacterium TaxID=581187 RepID=A0A6J4I3I4_9ACTN|nr:MAG: TldD family protein, Actinobacterial subgroup [uncultured Corynebacteriales bacterium]
MFDMASAAVEAALAAGARYADARAMHLRNESMSARNGDVEDLVQRESVGVGVRALVGSSWGFVAVPDPAAAAARRAGAEAAAAARASARVPGPDVTLVPVEVRQDSWSSPCEEDPLAVPLAEKGDLVAGVTATMHAAGVSVAEAAYQVWDTSKFFVSSEGSRLEQRIRECGAMMNATVIGDGESQRRSYPGIRGQYGTRGWELVRSLDLPGNAERVAAEARALLTAPECPAGETDLILGSEQMALQIHESVGHAVELDRILGWEAAFAGTSWLDLAQLGSLRFGSDLMTITADATLPGALGSFGYDDEGTPATPVDIVRDGIWTGVLSGRDSASVAGLDHGGMVRADGWARLPMVRMTNVGLLPGTSSLEEMISETRDGILMDTNRSWSIDDRRLNFQFGCEIGWEIKNGRRGRMLRNPTYTGISPRFWGSMDMLGGPDEWVFWGTPNCGKGQPTQIGHTGHPSVPARFRGVRVGVRG